MNALATWNRLRWNQLNELEDLQDSLGSLFSRCCVHWPEKPVRVPQCIPLVAVTEDARGYVFKADLPEVKQENVKITLKDGTLTITGERRFNLNRKKGHPVEHACGCFAHSFEVPADARPPTVSAVFKNGVLTVRLAKSSYALFASRPGVFLHPDVALEPQGSI